MKSVKRKINEKPKGKYRHEVIRKEKLTRREKWKTET